MPYDYPIKFGKYFLTRRIAVGGMAEVFKAKLMGIKGFEKTLALKRILPEFSEDEEFVQMFVDEARISSNLHHSNIVQVFDFGRVDTSYYIAMEYVDGPNLKNLLQRYLKGKGSFPRNLTLFIIIQIARALEYAHNVRVDGTAVLNLVHRDVSPQNVLISRSGEVKITDFGIAKAAIKLSKTQPGKIQGKFSYMSPEQALGKTIDRRSDIFSLGIIAFELLTGIKVYAAEDTHRRYKEVREAQIPRLGTLVKDLPAEVEDLIMQMVSKNPEDRPKSASEIAARLSELLSDISTEQLGTELGGIIDEIFPSEKSDSNINRKISMLREGEIVSNEPATEIQSQSVGEKTDFPAKTPAISGEDTTIVHWYSSILGSPLMLAAIASLAVLSLVALFYFSRSTPPPKPGAPDKPTAESAPQVFSTPRSGPVDVDLRAAAAKGEPRAEKRLHELETKLKVAEKRADDAQRDLKKAERKLEEVEKVPVVIPPKRACPPDMVAISSGTFLFGSNREDPDRNDLVEPLSGKVPLQKFCVDRFEYPNQRKVMPKTEVTWAEAQTLCNKEGKRLCAQEEWERSCKGPTTKQNRRFPYGDVWITDRCNTEKRDKSSNDTVDRPIASSGAFPECVSPDGVYDLSGNVDEWTVSHGRYSADGRITRGGSSKHPGWATRCSSVREVLSTAREPNIGFRCCKDAS